MIEATPGDAFKQFVTAPVRVSTYKRLLYLLLAFPLGIAYFLVFTTASSLGVVLTATLVGLPILLVTLVGTTGAAELEARLAEVLLDRKVAKPPSIRQSLDIEDGYNVALRRFLTEPATWTSVVVVLLKFVYGITAFSVIVTGVVTVVTMLSAPFVYNDPGTTYRIGSHAVTTLPEAIGIAGIGLIGLWIVCNVFNALAVAGGVMTDVLLSLGRGADAQ